MPNKFHCKRCEDLRFIYDKDGVRQACSCVHLRQLKIYAPVLIESMFKLSEKKRQEAKNLFSKEGNYYLNIPRSEKEDFVNGVMLNFLLMNQCPKYAVINVYELIETFLGKHPKYNSMFQIDYPAIILTEGYNEFPNVRQEEAILQFLDIVKEKRYSVLLISRKKTDELIMDYIRRNDWIQASRDQLPQGKKRVI